MSEDPAANGSWAAIGDRLETFARLHADGAVSEVPCHACGYPTLSGRDGGHFCIVCHWHDDGSSRDHPDHPSAANHDLTLREAAAHIAETGVFAAPGWVFNAPEFFVPDVRAARDELREAYEQVLQQPGDPAARQAVTSRRVRLMSAIANAMR